MASNSGEECRALDTFDSLEGPAPVPPIDLRLSERGLGEGTLSKLVSGVRVTMRDVDRTRLIFGVDIRLAFAKYGIGPVNNNKCAGGICSNIYVLLSSSIDISPFSSK